MATPKTIGILGGMGPEATADLFRRIIRATPAKCDQEHLHILIDNDPSVADRTASILAGDVEPVVAKLIEMARRLEAAGADLLVMPCNTAHAFLERVQPQVSVHFIDMIDEPAGAIRRRHPAVRTVGLLATTGTLRTRLYHERCERNGVLVMQPVDVQQERVMAALHAVKSDGPGAEAKRALSEEAAALTNVGVEAIIAGCTEIPLALTQEDVAVPLINPTEELAQAAVRAALSAELS